MSISGFSSICGADAAGKHSVIICLPVAAVCYRWGNFGGKKYA